jgi:glycerol-3-phosphate cytidylyltransferase
MKSQRIMVDMSATLLHHGHVRLLEKAGALGTVVVALTTDEDVLRAKGYHPELSFAERKELVKAIRFVDEVVPSPWSIDDAFLDANRIDLLVHGHDNANLVSPHRLLLFERTEGISSSILRQRVLNVLQQTAPSPPLGQ